LHSGEGKAEKLAAVERAMQEVRDLLKKDADAARVAAALAEERERRETEAAEQRVAAIRAMLSVPTPTEPPAADAEPDECVCGPPPPQNVTYITKHHNLTKP
jgi:anthranilate phosphoribosyltransferase